MKKAMIILVGPSGAGKSSLVQWIEQNYSNVFDTTTYTTRPMRTGEFEGHPYHFVSEKRFRELVGENFFVEWAEVHGRLYGTPRDQIDQAWAEGKTIVMDVDVQGARTFKKEFPHALAIFIMPPDIDALRNRIKKRDGEGGKDVALRMENARKEMACVEEFDHCLVNDEFERACGELQKVIEDYLAKG